MLEIHESAEMPGGTRFLPCAFYDDNAFAWEGEPCLHLSLSTTRSEPITVNSVGLGRKSQRSSRFYGLTAWEFSEGSCGGFAMVPFMVSSLRGTVHQACILGKQISSLANRGWISSNAALTIPWPP